MLSYQDSSDSGVSFGSFSTRSSTSVPEDVTECLSSEELDLEYSPLVPPERHGSGRPGNFRENGNGKFNSMKCMRHNEQIRFYCNDCKTKGCFDCVVKYHETCNVVLLKKFTLKICETALGDDFEEFTELKANLENIRRSFDADINNIQIKIDLIADKIIQEIQRERHLLLQKLKLVQAERHKSWLFQTELCQISLNTLKSYMMKLRKLELSDINFLRQHILTNIRLGLDFIECGEIEFDFNGFPKYQFGKIKVPASPSKSIVVLPENSFSNMYNTCTVFIRNLLEEPVDGNYTVTVSMQDSDFKPVYLTIRNENNGKFTISYYPMKAGEYLLYIYLNRSPIREDPLPVNVFRRESELIPRCRFVIEETEDRKLSKPWGICVDCRGRILVVDRGNNCVKFFTEDGKFLTSFGKAGSGPGEFNKPTGIAVDHVLERIVVVDKDNHRVQVFNLSGIYLLGFGSMGTETGQFVYPWDVSVSGSSLIAISDTNNHRIQVFDQRGGFIRQFLFNVKDIPEIEMPRGLAFRVDGFLMVTDFNKHRVVVLDDSFESAKAFGSEGTQLAKFYRPQSIDVDRMGRFAVSDCRNDRVQVFRPDGELFCAFGTKGNNPHELDSPQGVCFLSNNRIAVVELNNNRIKVFQLPKET